MPFAINNARCTRTTPLALLVESNELDDETWVPRSVVDDGSEVKDAGDEGKLLVRTWFATKEGWT